MTIATAFLTLMFLASTSATVIALIDTVLPVRATAGIASTQVLGTSRFTFLAVSTTVAVVTAVPLSFLI